MEDPLRIGVIGCGSMGREHMRLIASMSEGQLAGVCDTHTASAQRAAEMFGVPAWTDLDRFLEEARPEVVHICSPSGLHADQAMAAAERGVHVLSEKPLDLNLEKVDRLIALCDRQGVWLGCIFQRRMSRALQTVRQAIVEGRMGRILSCSVSIKWWRSQEYYNSSPWRGTWALDGGALANQGIHALDQMVWMAGPVEEVEYAHLETAMHAIEVEDLAIAVVRFASGARGVIEVTTCCRPDLGSRMEIYGTNGAAAFEDARVVRFGLDGEDLMPTLDDPGMLTGGGSDPMAIQLAGHEAQIRDFYRAIRERRPPVVDGREARLSVDLLNRIYARARPGQKPGT
ncbi:MAG: Gfo/Idh/MocA family oxidoreductase [Chloroherpetonaceae bacterium]|nr:Gfo/Idh/MocA family oxidoreductase [Chthonomonadaceae bacterium]MDW8206883.1 Gfo/Idh/MocA family oxidoreductase [Chloroherpetonaceae bacterium]